MKLQSPPRAWDTHLGQAAGNQGRVISYDGSCKVVEAVLRLAVEHEDVVKCWRWEGRGLQQVTELAEAVGGIAVHVEQRCVVQSHLQHSMNRCV